MYLDIMEEKFQDVYVYFDNLRCKREFYRLYIHISTIYSYTKM